jgi:hypothetical protein
MADELSLGFTEGAGIGAATGGLPVPVLYLLQGFLSFFAD